MKTVRCAIYTRKSSDEGLEQAFNSLDAQREACAAYILSQASEGWTALPAIYDDGGLSGGTLQRPALQRLLADVAAGQIDIIVVYKVDRLTRSLFDFAKLVEALDKANTSFVSVTQSFNTTTSMGRLTLNMLLSFAQFEREVTAERIRDKIAASKAKGMWMGGTPPLGYAPDNRTLKIVEPEADLVRHLFARYLALGSVRLLEDELRAGGVTLPIRTRLKAGQTFGGGCFSRGQLYAILRNPIYIGRIAHGERSYPGLHPAIIDADAWEQTQAKLTEQRRGDRTTPRAASPSLLAGKVIDDKDVPLIATHANKAGRRYRYYVSRDLHLGNAQTGMRIPAREIEGLVLDRVGELFRDPLQLAASAGLDVRPHMVAELERRCAEFAPTKLVASVITCVRVAEDRVELTCSTSAIGEVLQVRQQADAHEEVIISLDARLTRSGRVLRLVHAGSSNQDRVSPSLVSLLVQAHRWWAELRKGELEIKALAKRDGVTGSYLTRVLRLAFLSPSLTQAILAGRQPVELSARALTLEGRIDARWPEQARRYGGRA